MSAYSVSAHGLAMRKVPQGVLDTVNQLLFDAGQVGGNLSFSDFSKIWQDSAGTTPYTAVEQYVGKIVDKSPNALAFTQATSAARPVVSARVNLLVSTEDLTAASWAKAFSGTGSLPVITPGQLAPDGSSTAFRVQLNRGAGSSSSDYSFIRQAINLVGAGRRTIWCKSNTGSTQTFSLVATLSSDVVSATTSWARVTGGSLSSAGQLDLSNYGPVPTTQNLDIIVWHPDVRSNGTPIGIPAYQRVNTSTDYDTVGFPDYLKFDGIDDNIVSAAGGGGTAGIYYCGAIHFNKVGAVQTIFSDAGTSSGYKLQLTAANQLQISAGNGTAYTTVNTTGTFAVGDVALVELWDDGTNLGVRLGEGTPVTIARPVVTAGTAKITLGKDNNAASNYAGIGMFEPMWRYGAMPNTTQREAIRAICRSKAGIA